MLRRLKCGDQLCDRYGSRSRAGRKGARNVIPDAAQCRRRGVVRSDIARCRALRRLLLKVADVTSGGYTQLSDVLRGAHARVRVQIENAVRNLGTLAVVDMVYGVAVLRDEAAVLLNCSNTYIMS